MKSYSKTNDLYHVRQIRPHYLPGCRHQVVKDVPYEQITEAPWFRNFEYPGFERFAIEPFGEELIIIAKYHGGEYRAAGVAANTKHEVAKGWRYFPHEQAPIGYSGSFSEVQC